MEQSGDVPGLQSVAMATGTPLSRNSWTGGGWLFVERQVGARQQYGRRAGIGERPHTRVRRVFEVVGGQGAEVRREFRAAAVAELVGMQLDPQA